jgi:hypothetical protein
MHIGRAAAECMHARQSTRLTESSTHAELGKAERCRWIEGMQRAVQAKGGVAGHAPGADCLLVQQCGAQVLRSRAVSSSEGRALGYTCLGIQTSAIMQWPARVNERAHVTWRITHSTEQRHIACWPGLSGLRQAMQAPCAPMGVPSTTPHVRVRGSSDCASRGGPQQVSVNVMQKRQDDFCGWVRSAQGMRGSLTVCGSDFTPLDFTQGWRNANPLHRARVRYRGHVHMTHQVKFPDPTGVSVLLVGHVKQEHYNGSACVCIKALPLTNLSLLFTTSHVCARVEQVGLKQGSPMGQKDRSATNAYARTKLQSRVRNSLGD